MSTVIDARAFERISNSPTGTAQTLKRGAQAAGAGALFVVTLAVCVMLPLLCVRFRRPAA